VPIQANPGKVIISNIQQNRVQERVGKSREFGNFRFVFHSRTLLAVHFLGENDPKIRNFSRPY